MEDQKNPEPEQNQKKEIAEEKLDNDSPNENKKEEKIEEKQEEGKKEEDKKEDKKEEDKKEDKKEEDKKEDEKEDEKDDKKDKKKKKKEKEKKDKEKKEKEKKEKKEREKKKKEEEKKKKEEEKKKKEEEKKSDKVNIIYSIDEQNKLCVDCGSENPTKVSINNGILICENCAKEHELLGSSISYLKNINDDYDEFLINFIVLGSNTKFKRFLTNEKVDLNLPIKDKYKTQAVNYYRKNLKAKVEGKDEIKKEYKDPNEILNDLDDNYPEFNKKYVIKNQVLKKGNLINQNKFSFMFIFNKVFNRKKKKRGKSFDKKKKNDITNEIDMNKTMPPELLGDKKEDIPLESNRPFQEDKKEEKKDDKKKKEKEKEKEKEDDDDMIKEAKNEIKDKEI